MLRITAIVQPTGVTLKLEGKVLEPWLDVLETACRRATRESPNVALDLNDVSFIDADGRELVRSLLDGGITITRCSDFVAELLHHPERV